MLPSGKREKGGGLQSFLFFYETLHILLDQNEHIETEKKAYIFILINLNMKEFMRLLCSYHSSMTTFNKLQFHVIC